MKTIADEVADWLRASPPGTRMWVRGLGRSMWPLLREGDAVQVERCQAEQLHRGEIALTQPSQGVLSAHLVFSNPPLRTGSFLGKLDPPGAVLGRAVALEWRGRRFPLPAFARGIVWGLHRVALGLRTMAGGRRR